MTTVCHAVFADNPSTTVFTVGTDFITVKRALNATINNMVLLITTLLKLTSTTMVEAQSERLLSRASKKRHVLTAELGNKLSAKADFVKYFRECCKCPLKTADPRIVQLYVPPDTMMNKDFLKAVLADEKKLMLLSQVKFKHVPLYDELSVVQFWPLMQEDAQFMQYMPSKLPRGRVPDREYFWNVLNTLNEEYVQQLISHAIGQRNSAAGEDMEAQAIEVTEGWLEQLKAVPFVSCKSIFVCDSFVARKGKTIHLLKMASKPVPQERKRRKISIIATPKEFLAAKEEVKREDEDMPSARGTFKDITADLKRPGQPYQQQEQK